MRIEISNRSKTNLSNKQRNSIYELTNKCINSYYLISEKNEGKVILECVPKEYIKKIKKLLSNEYEISITDDDWMAQIDMMDLLSGGRW